MGNAQSSRRAVGRLYSKFLASAPDSHDGVFNHIKVTTSGNTPGQPIKLQSAKLNPMKNDNDATWCIKDATTETTVMWAKPDGRLFSLEDANGNCVLRMTRATCTLHNRIWLLLPQQGPAQRADAPVEIVCETHSMKGTVSWRATLKGEKGEDERILTVFGDVEHSDLAAVKAVLVQGAYGKGGSADSSGAASNPFKASVLARFQGSAIRVAKETREAKIVKERTFELELADGLDVPLVVALALLWHKGVPANNIRKATGGGSSSSASSAGSIGGACTCSSGACTC